MKDPDITIIKQCCKWLDDSSPRMLEANIDFLYDRYVVHRNEPARLARRAVRAQRATERAKGLTP